MHYVVGKATSSLYIHDELRPFHLTLSTSKWTSYIHAMAILTALMVCKAGIVADDVEKAFTDKDHGEQLRHGNLATLPSLDYPNE